MLEAQLDKGNKLREQRKQILRELEVWERELTKKSKLGYLQSWNNNHPAQLETNISDEIFTGFRCAAMDNLKLKLALVEQEFADLVL